MKSNPVVTLPVVSVRFGIGTISRTLRRLNVVSKLGWFRRLRTSPELVEHNGTNLKFFAHHTGSQFQEYKNAKVDLMTHQSILKGKVQVSGRVLTTYMPMEYTTLGVSVQNFKAQKNL